MGCRVSSHESLQNIPTNTTMPRHSDDVDYKSRLERKLCLAKETPEPYYDLSDCNLKEVPSGVYIMCRILLKDELNLSNNKITNLTSSGQQINDLNLIKIFNLNTNKIKKLPNDIWHLANLRELHLQNNLLEMLPAAMCELKHLEVLNLSANKLHTIDPITMMPSLRLLNLCDNKKLCRLPNGLTTCKSLVNIQLDAENYVYPPGEIVQLGTMEILQYLVVHNNETRDPGAEVRELTERFIDNEKTERHHVERKDRNISYSAGKAMALIEHEKLTQEKDYYLEAQLHNEQQKKKQLLLEQLLQDQCETDAKVNNLQKAKQLERDRLISHILHDEEYATMLVENLLCLKNGPDSSFIERENQEQEELLDKLHQYQCDLRKQEILAEMTNFIENEMNLINIYQVQRDTESRNILVKEYETNKYLEDLFDNYDKNRMDVINEIKQNEELQKTAVTALIAQNDARSWGLVEQVRIVEAQLAKMTFYEIERRKISNEDAVDELSEARVNLTLILIDLLDQQEKRRLQLRETLNYIEEQNEENRKDYWLIQYQKLIDTRPDDITMYSQSIDPLLGYNFLINGVIHCLPYLSKFWQHKTKSLDDISDDDLQNAGIKHDTDRRNILKSIRDFITDQMNTNSTQSHDAEPELAQEAIEPVAIGGGGAASATSTLNNNNNTIERDNKNTVRPLTECVVCMDRECQMIFLPCGHLCSCLECHLSLHECPMCRGKIERRIKVIAT